MRTLIAAALALTAGLVVLVSLPERPSLAGNQPVPAPQDVPIGQRAGRQQPPPARRTTPVQDAPARSTSPATPDLFMPDSPFADSTFGSADSAMQSMQSRYVELAREYAALVAKGSDDERFRAILDEFERQVVEARAEARLADLTQGLAKVVEEYEGTPAAATARRMLDASQPSAAEEADDVEEATEAADEFATEEAGDFAEPSTEAEAFAP